MFLTPSHVAGKCPDVLPLVVAKVTSQIIGIYPACTSMMGLGQMVASQNGGAAGCHLVRESTPNLFHSSPRIKKKAGNGNGATPQKKDLT